MVVIAIDSLCHIPACAFLCLQGRAEDIKSLQARLGGADDDVRRVSSLEKELERERSKVTGLVAQLRSAEKHYSAAAAASAVAAGGTTNPKGLAAEVVAMRSRMTTLEKEVCDDVMWKCCLVACLYVYIHACLYACLYVCMCMYLCMNACMFVCLHVCMYVCMHVCVYV